MRTALLISPDQAALIRAASNRLLAAGAIIYLLCLLLIPFPKPFWAISIITGGSAAAFGVLITTNRRWIRRMGWMDGRAIALPFPLSHRYQIANTFFAFMCTAPLMAFRPLASLSLFLALPFLASGLSFAIAALRVKERVSPACPRCGYDAASLRFPNRCPECGHPFRSISDATVLAHVRRPTLLWIGTALVLAGIIISSFAPLHRQHTVALLPLSWRLAAAPRDRDAFATIDPVSITQAHRSSLVDRIIDQRSVTKDYLLNEQINWVATEMANARISQHQADRFAMEHVRADLLTRAWPRMGQQTGLTFQVTGPSLGFGGITRWYFVRSLTMDQTTLLDQDPTPRVPAQVLARLPARPAEPGPLIADPQPIFAPAPTTPGTQTARIEVIMITIPAHATPTITWHPDGTYTITPTPLTTHELTAETTLQVTP